MGSAKVQPTQEPRAAEAQAGAAVVEKGNTGSDVRVDVEAAGPDIVLLKVADLLNNPLLQAFTPCTDKHGKQQLGMNSYVVEAQHWHSPQKSIAGVFGQDSFVTIPWSELETTRYAVLTYCWGGRPWSELIRALKGWEASSPNSPNDAGKAAPEKRQLEVEYVWIDIFCLDQNDPDKMNTINNSYKIYGWASEYHVMGFDTFKRGWCLCEYGVAKAPMIVYSVFDGLGEEVSDVVGIMHRFDSQRRVESELTKLLSFETASFFDEDDRPRVRRMIEDARGSVEGFNAYLLEKVTNDETLRRLIAELWEWRLEELRRESASTCCGLLMLICSM